MANNKISSVTQSDAKLGADMSLFSALASSKARSRAASKRDASMIDMLFAGKAKSEARKKRDPNYDPEEGQKLSLITRAESEGLRPGDAICQAAERGWVDVLRCLVEEVKLDPNSENVFHMTALLESIEGNRVDVVRYLAPISDHTIEGEYHKLPMSMAAIVGSVELCEILMPHAVFKSSDGKDGFGWTPLMYAVGFEKGISCIAMLAKHFSLATRKGNGVDVLGVAVENWQVQSVDALLALSPGPTNASIQRSMKIVKDWPARYPVGGPIEMSLEREWRRRQALAERKELGKELAKQRAASSSKPKRRL